MKNQLVIMLILSVLTFSSCKKEGCMDENAINYNDKAKKDDGSCQFTDTEQESGKVIVSLEHQWGDNTTNFQLETEYIHATTGDTLEFTKLMYFISNLKLKRQDGTWWSHPESYFLVDLANTSSTQLNLEGVPLGNYTEVSYIMGVDSLRNVSGAQTGALSTTSGMFWSWNSGYIMVKAEGLSPQASMGGAFTYHLGGFAGANNIVTLKNATFGAETLNVTKSSNSKIYLSVDPSKLFTTIGSVNNVGMIHSPGANSLTMATDFYNSGVTFNMIQN